jgi:transposase-like protein
LVKATDPWGVAQITRTLRCPACQGSDLQRWGRTSNDKPRFRCNACKKTFLDSDGYTPQKGQMPGFVETVLAAYQERSSMRGIARTFGISRNTLANWLKKSRREG